MLSLFFAGKQKVPVMNYSMLCDIQFSGELFGPSEEYEKLSRPILLHFLSNTGICGDHAKSIFSGPPRKLNFCKGVFDLKNSCKDNEKFEKKKFSYPNSLAIRTENPV